MELIVRHLNSLNYFQRKKLATCESLASEDWGMNLQICDLINQKEDGPKDAVRAIKKRLSSQPKNYTVVMYTLTVLETCVKNCGGTFHLLVCSKDFVQELVKLIGPKNEPPTVVQEKVLSLIQSWAEAFRHQPELSGVCQIYAELKHKGLEFPPLSADTSAPIITPGKAVAAGGETHRISPAKAPGGNSPGNHPSRPSGPPAALSADQKGKLLSELSIVESNVKVLSEMLSELTPGKEHAEDRQLLKDLHATCHAMQHRVVQLIGQVTDDTLTEELLRVNDDINNVFVRYDRYMSKVKGIANEASGGAATMEPQRTAAMDMSGARMSKSNVKKPPKDEVSLIDLGDDDLLSHQAASLTIKSPNPGAEEVDFDAFAQSRTGGIRDVSTLGQSLPLNAEPSERGKVSVHDDLDEGDFAEMERWLKEEPGLASQASAGDALKDSQDFDQFLSHRVAAAATLPSIPSATGSVSETNPQQ